MPTFVLHGVHLWPITSVGYLEIDLDLEVRPVSRLAIYDLDLVLDLEGVGLDLDLDLGASDLEINIVISSVQFIWQLKNKTNKSYHHLY